MAKYNPIYGKRAAFRGGHYKCEVPPSYHGNWDIDTWIDWIDTTGVWT